MLEFILGFMSFGFAEYVVHRFILHTWWPASHGDHHANPLDDSVGLSWRTTAALIIIVGGIMIPFGLIFLFLGLLFGYVVYALVHWACHHETRWGISYLTRLHSTHHRLGDKNFGVTSPLWDLAFRTYDGGRSWR